MNKLIAVPLAAIIIAANVWAIVPAIDKEFENNDSAVISHKFDNLDNQAK